MHSYCVASSLDRRVLKSDRQSTYRQTIGLTLVLVTTHLVEELVTGFPANDVLTGLVADALSLSPLTVVLGAAVLSIGALGWLFVRRRDVSKHPVGTVIVLAILLFEVTHITDVVRLGAYIPGSLTALLMVGLGVWYLIQLTAEIRRPK